MQARMKSPVMVYPEAMQAILALYKPVEQAIPANLRKMVELRASQINGCSFCVDMHSRELKHAGESDERIFTVAAWREAPWFTEAERAALELTEALTRIADRPDPVSDELWDRATRYFDEKAISALLLVIAAINVWNRLNVATRQPASRIKV